MTSEADGVSFKILGPLECWSADQRVPVGGQQQERLLFCLLLEANRTIPVSRLIDAVWDGAGPATAVHQIRKMVADLRRRIPGGGTLLRTEGPGYRVLLADEQLDLTLFSIRLRRAREAWTTGLLPNAVEELQAGLALWRGPVPGAGGPALLAAVAEIEEQRLNATEELIGLRLELGAGVELVGELRRLVGQNPLRERLRAHLMLALFRAARQAEALEEYARIRELLAEELGIDPCMQLMQLHGEILRGNPELLARPQAPGSGLDGVWGIALPDTGHAEAGQPGQSGQLGQLGLRGLPGVPSGQPGHPGGSAAAETASGGADAPCSLPYDVPDFTGREALLKGLFELAQPGPMVRIISLEGMGGSGKTSLAVHAAHRLAERYPDGQLYIDLVGFTPGQPPLSPEVALDVLLRTLGVPGERIPDGLLARLALWRVTTAQRRLLVLLDNAAGAEQVQPLLPTAPGCLVLVTSRVRLFDVDGATAVPVDVLSVADSVRLLARVLGEERLAAEPDAVHELIELCGGLPLALRICAGRLADRPHWSLAHLVERLGQESRRLRELRGGARGVAASLSLSYLAMTAELQSAFRLLGLLPGQDFDEYTAAALFGTGIDDAEDQLERLVDLNLLRRHGPGRYLLHDLLRSYARELADPERHEEDRQATVRLLDYYYQAVLRAAGRLYPGKPRIYREGGETVVDLPRLATPDDALDWLNRERTNVLAAVRLAHDSGVRWHAVVIPRVFCEYLNAYDYLQESLDAARLGLAAAEALDDAMLCAVANRTLGSALWNVSRLEESLEYGLAALRLAEERGDDRAVAGCLNSIGACYNYLGDYATALVYRERSLEIHERNGERREVGNSLIGISSICGYLGDYRRSEEAARDAAAIFLEVGEPSGQSLALVNLANAQLGKELPDEALGVLAEAWVLAQNGGGVGQAALVAARIAQAHLALGDQRAAVDQVECLQEALIGGVSPALSVRLQNVLGAVRLRGREYASAAGHFRSALTQAQQIRFRVGEAEALQGLAEAEEASGDATEAASHRDEARALFDAMGIAQGHVRTC